MNIYLINPPAPVRFTREGRCTQKSAAWMTPWPPLTLALSAAVLEEEGFTVRLDDCPARNMDFRALCKEVARFTPDLLILAVSTPSLFYDLETVRELKKTFPGLKTAVLGVHVTVFPEETLNQCKDLDFVIRGEPEYTLRDLAMALRGGEPLKEVQGLVWRNEEALTVNEGRPWLNDLDAMPFPAWHLLDRGCYRLPLSRKPFLSLFSARGCPYRCIFCAADPYYGKKIRQRSARRVVDEIEHNVKSFNTSDFLFWTESFTASRELVLHVCEELTKRRISIRWFCNSRVDHVDRELIEVMKKAGCKMISFGVESFTPAVLDAAKKGTTPEQAEEAIMLTHQLGLQVIAHCILGLPGETEETLRHTVRRILELPVDYAQFYAAVPFPGSELYAMAVEKGWIEKSGTEWKNFEQETCILSPGPELTAGKVRGIRDEAYRRFYLRPRFIAGLIMNFLREGSPGAFFDLWKKLRGMAVYA